MGLKPRQRDPALPSFSLEPDAGLRPLRRSDARELFAVVDANRARLREWLPWLDATPDERAVLRFLDDTALCHQRGAALRMAITVRGRIAGVASLEAIDPLHRTAFIGYWIAAAHEGRGLITAASGRLCDHAFDTLDLNLIEIRAAVDNQRSRAVPERLGFRFEAVVRQREWLYDHFVDHAVYSILADEWRDARTS